jgi:hypothetical protein
MAGRTARAHHSRLVGAGRREEGKMKSRRFWMVAASGVGLLQTWDSGAFAVGGWVLALALLGVLAPVVSIALEVGRSVRIGALVFAAVALTLARWSSPQPLNALHLALLPAALYILVVPGLRYGAANTPV